VAPAAVSPFSDVIVGGRPRRRRGAC